jgi:hypothetical protein
MTRVCAFFSVAIGLLLSGAAVRAHPLHISVAEADYRPESGKLEIALRLFSDDAEAVLARRTGQKISVEKTPSAELDRLLTSYVKEAFVIKTRGGSSLAFTWLGHELKDANQHLWLYFESALPGGVEGLRIASRVMRDEFSDQLNSVLVRDHSPTGAKSSVTRQATLLFTDDEEQTASFRK